jgi:hypothetical protein
MKSRAATDMQSGSLAIWYRWSAPAKRRQSTKAAVELHVNLWRRRIKTRSNKEESFIDLGFRFRDASSVSNFRIYVPFHLEQKDIHDLGQILHHRETLMAVFNEAYVPGDIDDTGTFPIMNQNDPAIMYCHCLRPGIDFTSSISDQGGHIGTIINFTASLCGRFKPEVEQYIRFRVILNAQRDRAFSKLTRQFDWIFLSAIPRDEVVEFRFNEHRSLPQEIIDQMAAQEEYEQFDLRAVHCFLIRESDSHFVMSHADFHKVRLLEDNLWSKYLSGTAGGGLQHNSFIYHWRRIGLGDTDLGDYHALAKFRRNDHRVVDHIVLCGHYSDHRYHGELGGILHLGDLALHQTFAGCAT